MGLFRKKQPEAVPEERAMSWAQVAAMAKASSASYGYGEGGVSLDGALKSAAAWACITRLKATISSLPVDVVRAQGDRRFVLPKASQPMLIRTPSGVVTRRQWIGQVVHGLTTAGNAYGDVIDVDGQGRPLMIETINTGRVKWLDGAPYVDGSKRSLWPLGDLWHLAASHLMVDGSGVALSPVEYGSQSIATGLRAERYGSDFFSSGGVPVSVLKSATQATKTQADEAKQAVLDATKHRGVLALGGGWDLTPFSIDPKDTQFLELLQYTVLDASRRWLVPPSMIFATMTGASLTYQNISDADLQYWKHGVSSWTLDLEDAWAEMIPGQLEAKFRVDAILRMDKAARTAEHKVRLETKTRTINEVRRLEDEEPFDDPIYDEPGIPGGAAPSAPDPTSQGGAA